jgi:multidrug efflux pump subunit AcrA (membrane-fusion protein)
MVKLVQPNQNAFVDTRKGIVKGRVSSISAEIANGMGSVDIALEPSPEVGFTAGHQIDATIDIEKLDNILQVGRPASVPANSTDPVSGSVFKIVDDGKEAERVVVKFGRSSVNTIEVLDGLKEGDKIILSDMSSMDKAYRIHFTDQMHLIKH